MYANIFKTFSLNYIEGYYSVMIRFFRMSAYFAIESDSENVRRLREAIHELLIEPIAEYMDNKRNSVPPLVMIIGEKECVLDVMGEILRQLNEMFPLIEPRIADFMNVENAEQEINEFFNFRPDAHYPIILIIENLDYLTPEQNYDTTGLSIRLNRLISRIRSQESSSENFRMIILPITNKKFFEFLFEQHRDILRDISRLRPNVIYVQPPREEDMIRYHKYFCEKYAVKIPSNILSEISMSIIPPTVLDRIYRELAYEQPEDIVEELKRQISDPKKTVSQNEVEILDRIAEELNAEPRPQKSEKKGPKFIDVGGNDRLKVILAIIAWRFMHNKDERIFPILFYGPPGVGKTFITRAFANEFDFYYISLRGGQLHSIESIEYEFQKAYEHRPAVIFVDEAEAILGTRTQEIMQTDVHLVDFWLRVLGEESPYNGVIAIFATNKPEDIDPAILRRMRLIYYLSYPDIETMKDIVRRMLARIKKTRGVDVDDVDPNNIAELAYKRRLVLSEISNALIDLSFTMEKIATEDLEERLKNARIVPYGSFDKAIGLRIPFTQRQIENFVDSHREIVDRYGINIEKIRSEAKPPKPSPNFCDVYGNDLLKSMLLFLAIRYKKELLPPCGVLLYGPSGTGKTYIAKCFGNEFFDGFTYIPAPKFLSKWVGDSEKRIRETFLSASARAPSIVVIDEAESVLLSDSQIQQSWQRNLVNQFLSILDGDERYKGVIAIFTTNRPDLIRDAFLDRMKIIMYLGYPDKTGLEIIIRGFLENLSRKHNIDVSNVDASKIVDFIAKKRLSLRGVRELFEQLPQVISITSQKSIDTDTILRNLRGVSKAERSNVDYTQIRRIVGVRFYPMLVDFFKKFLEKNKKLLQEHCIDYQNAIRELDRFIKRSREVPSGVKIREKIIEKEDRKNRSKNHYILGRPLS